MYLNKAIIIGNLTRDPELRALPSGFQVASFGVATNRVYYDKDKNKKEDTQFHNVVVFGRQAETTAKYLKKGSSILVEGRMQTRSWDDKGTGEKKYRTEIVADKIQFGPRTGTNTGEPRQDFTSDSGKKKTSAEEPDTIDYPEEEINPEDIPF